MNEQPKRRGRPPKDEPQVTPAENTPEVVQETPRSKGIPPCPEMDPMAGDKTPEVVAWWFQYHPEEAAAKYKGRKFGNAPVTLPRDQYYE